MNTQHQPTQVLTFSPDFGGEPAPATLAQPRATWRTEVRNAASPELQALITAAKRAEQAYRKERLVGAEMRKAITPFPSASDADVQAATETVEPPEILREPVTGRRVASIQFNDGTVVELSPGRPYTVLTDEQIAERFADDPQRAAEARAARLQYDRDVSVAVAEAHRSARSPEIEKAYRASQQWERKTLYPLHDAWEQAKRALRTFHAPTPADRLAQILEIFEIEGGQISRNGKVTDPEDAFEGREGVELAQLVFDALGAAVDADFDAGAWIDAFESLPGHTIDGRGPCFMEPDAWPDGDYGKGPTGHALWTSLSPAQKEAVRREGATRRPIVPPDIDFSKMTYTPVARGSGPAIPRELYAAE